MGVRAQDLAAVRGGTGDIESGANMTAEYFTWARLVQKRRLDHSMCMDTIAFGHSLRTIDANRRQPRGTAKDNLVKCLDLFQKIN